ncbi:MAG: hypothetical protein WA172_19750, partial [Terriglobales bacterium]
QKKLGLISNEVMLGETEWTGYLAAMASEEMEDIYPVPATGRRGHRPGGSAAERATGASDQHRSLPSGWPL